MKRLIWFVFLTLTTISIVHLLAQDKKKKKANNEKQAPAAISINDDSAVTVHPDSEIASPNRYYLFPEFYSYWPVDKNDTILKYECFDINHNPIITDTLTSPNDIHYISFVKIYNDYLKTYIDPEGKPRPQPIAKTLYTYERTGNDSWKSTDAVNNFTMTLREHKDQIVRKDTTYMTNPITGGHQLTIREYYKVTEVDGSGAVNPSATSNEADPNSHTTFTAQSTQPAEIVYYSVPEFYFHWPWKSRDTTFEFRCYDVRDSLIPYVSDYDSVHYFSLFKLFIDSTHTYRDNNGQKKPLPVEVIIKRYDKIGKEKWMSVEYPQNKFTELKAFPDIIVNIDTEAVVDPISDHTLMKIYRHYKVIKE